ncbi:putative oxidoreductase C-terminal domain-containing protein [Hufsiella ginkgonis]|uniref:Oxidoreductase n=1 Tax=Hufsiella ginkgonis TaxID=2695274 RepID=A0A7K1Y2Y7_9SPHI|nr:putative oxidoreductase C-terminal domain-containing protein [Hufsiella ginkgonis]MXV17645.1 oxidoreductase [Hufsiella ginkgonis]
MQKIKHAGYLALLFMASCTNNSRTAEEKSNVQLITLDPGHFHAALVQKSMYPGVDSVVHVYSPGGDDLNFHLDRVKGYNTRAESPTHWKEEVYTGPDFFGKMIAEKKGNVVVLSGNNQKKTEYINKSLEAGFNVLADKPMVITSGDFEVLKSAFSTAKAKNVLLYDIMTERYEITTILQRELSMLPGLFGTLEKGTPENPAITKESVHHFYKYVSGSVLTRPGWFMDVSQQGEGIVDVTTHLVDLVQWECFPDQALDYTKDVTINSAKRWTTPMTLSQFSAITKLSAFPEYLNKEKSNDSTLAIYSNGEINYTLKGVHAKVSVTWAYKAPEGGGDTHFSVMRGSKLNLAIRQGKEQGYKPALYLENAGTLPDEKLVQEQFKTVEARYPGITLKKQANGWEVVIPEKYKEGHESHFARVTGKFLDYLKNGSIPAWEVPNMLTKYYTTTQGLEVAKKTK